MRPAAVFPACVAAALVALVLLSAACVPAPGASQPIAFSHKKHAGDNKLECLYCHSGARRSPVAGIPSVRLCMGCHAVVAANRPEIARLRGYWDRKLPVRWTRVVDEPDYVFFNHFPHVAKGIRCQECHGPVETMEVLRLDHVLNMDRCVACHRERGGPIDCYACHR